MIYIGIALFCLLAVYFFMPRRAPALPLVRRINAGLYAAFGVFVAGIMLGFLHSGAWIFGGIAGALAIIAATGMEVVQPDRAGHMQFGRWVGVVDPGWHFPIAFISECCHRPGKDLTLDLGTMKVFTSRKTAITAKVTINYRLMPTDEDIKLACLRLPKNFTDAEVFFREAAESEVRSVLGKKDFGGLIPEQETLEKEMKEKIANDYKEWGFEVFGVKIRDFDEEVESEAERIRVQGLAQAQVRLEEAKAYQNNYPLAIATAVAALADGLSRMGGREKKKKKNGDGGQSENETDDAADQQNPLVSAAQDAAEALRGITGRRGRRRS